jgi:hypothetical protein
VSKTFTARVVTFALAGFVLSGCYNYIPTQLEVVPPGQEVQLLVTRAGARDLVEITDVMLGPVPSLRGAVQGVEDGDLLISIPIAMRQEGFIQSELLQTVRVPTDEILSISRRELSVGNTALAVAASAAGLGLIVFTILESFGGSSNQEGEEPDFSIFSLPVP